VSTNGLNATGSKEIAENAICLGRLRTFKPNTDMAKQSSRSALNEGVWKNGGRVHALVPSVLGKGKMSCAGLSCRAKKDIIH
jgi:hypothetical protein